jgi:hypothetical protein
MIRAAELLARVTGGKLEVKIARFRSPTANRRTNFWKDRRTIGKVLLLP